MPWSSDVHQYAPTAEIVGANIAAGMMALHDSSVMANLTHELPVLQPGVADLTNVVPGIGTADAAPDFKNFTAQHWAAVAQIGMAINSAPAGAMADKLRTPDPAVAELTAELEAKDGEIANLESELKIKDDEIAKLKSDSNVRPAPANAPDALFAADTRPAGSPAP